MAEEHADELMVAHLDGRMRVAQPAGAQQPGAAYAALPGQEVPSYSDDALLMVRASELRAFADATHALRASHGQAPAQAAHQPAATPQADSQPAPDEATAMSRTGDLAEAGRWPSDWVEAYRRGYSDRASRAPADSVTAPASGANWQDISTAPKDGTRFVAVGQNYGLDSEKQHTCIAQWLAGCWVEVSDWNGASKLKYLTHWMPLPPLPGSAARAPADSVLEDAARLERERICAAIKAEDDYCVDHGGYMLDSDDCIKIVRGEWVRPDFSVAAARKQGANHD